VIERCPGAGGRGHDTIGGQIAGTAKIFLERVADDAFILKSKER